MVRSNRNLRRRHPKQKIDRSPSFDSGILSEPRLVFGGHHEHVDSKTGLSLYGPYSLGSQSRPPLRNINVGIVGQKSMVADAEQGLRRFQEIVTNKGDKPYLYPYFPGFNSDLPLLCDLTFDETWRECYRDEEMVEALSGPFDERVKKTADLYIRCIETLSQRDPAPDVIICCIPKQVIEKCVYVKYKGGGIRPKKPPRIIREMIRKGQTSLFRERSPDSKEAMLLWGPWVQ